MVFLRISSALLRRKPFTSKSVSSFSSIISISPSPSNTFNLISKFHPQIFSNPRTPDFFQVRKYSVEIPSLIPLKKKRKSSSSYLKRKMAEYNLKVEEAEDAVEIAKESHDCFILWPYYEDNANRANKAINIVLEKYKGLMSKLGNDEKEDFEKANRWVIKSLKDDQEKLMTDMLMKFYEMLTVWNQTISSFKEAERKRSGGISSQIAGMDNADSGSSKASEVDQSHQPSSPILTPTSDFFAQALVDKEKEAVVIQFMKERYMPVIEMIKVVLNDVSGMGVEKDTDDLVRLLIKTAIRRPEVFNFECREANPGV